MILDNQCIFSELALKSVPLLHFLSLGIKSIKHCSAKNVGSRKRNILKASLIYWLRCGTFHRIHFKAYSIAYLGCCWLLSHLWWESTVCISLFRPVCTQVSYVLPAFENSKFTFPHTVTRALLALRFFSTRVTNNAERRV